tara:strand:- start:4760 stop:5584 length:825 start_codon:yes stop_codon:yes gene_type:complete
MKKLSDYDFLGSIYKNSKASELQETFESIKNQTHKPKNIFLVIDGYVEKNVLEIVEKYSFLLPLVLIPLKKNLGLGIALRKGLKKCESEIVLRFDTDDINLEKRAELIVAELDKGNVDIVGSNIYEFLDNPSILVSRKKMPLTHESICRTILYRNPINHPSVGFFKKSILKLQGGYRNFPFYEDYDLWIRALFSGLKFKNIEEELVGLRISNQRARRRGFKLIFSEFRLLFTFFNNSFLHGIFFIPSFLIRIIFALMPLKLVEFIFEKFLRNRP